MHRMLLAAALLLACAVVAATPPRCALHCYRGTVAWADGATLDYAFSVVPCAPVRVVSATLNDGGDTLLTPVFACTPLDGGVAISLDHAGGAHLEWRYATEDSCDSVLAALAAVPGVFVGTAHRRNDLLVSDGDSLEAAQIECTATSCAPLCFDSGVVQLAGVAGEKNPCGAVGTDACPVRVQYALSLCDTPPRVTAFDVLVGGDAVRLANFQPAAVVGAQLSCDGDSAALHLDAAGVALAWAPPADNAADCASLLLRPDVLATGALHSVVVQLDSDALWTADALHGQPIATSAALCNALPTEMPGATDASPPADEPEPEPVPEPAPEQAPTVATARPVTPHVHCSARRNGVCCSLFGYTNPNTAPVLLPRGRPHNFLVPGSDATAVELMQANATVDVAFAVTWNCPEYTRNTLRWVLQSEAPLGRWRRSADAARTRDDCSASAYNTWCT